MKLKIKLKPIHDMISVFPIIITFINLDLKIIFIFMKKKTFNMKNCLSDYYVIIGKINIKF